MKKVLSIVDGVAPMPWLKSGANWFPKTEECSPTRSASRSWAPRRCRFPDVGVGQWKLRMYPIVRMYPIEGGMER